MPCWLTAERQQYCLLSGHSLQTIVPASLRKHTYFPNLPAAHTLYRYKPLTSKRLGLANFAMSGLISATTITECLGMQTARFAEGNLSLAHTPILHASYGVWPALQTATVTCKAFCNSGWLATGCLAVAGPVIMAHRVCSAECGWITYSHCMWCPDLAPVIR